MCCKNIPIVDIKQRKEKRGRMDKERQRERALTATGCMDSVTEARQCSVQMAAVSCGGVSVFCILAVSV